MQTSHETWESDPAIVPAAVPPGDDQLRYVFPAALGDRYPATDPRPHDYAFEYTPKIKLEQKRGPSG
ncbi:MAG: hypothetical protein IT318_09825 [Anaerolineales bacterium]|nr:hypothetical protein [Anaerolineales bacterium]